MILGRQLFKELSFRKTNLIKMRRNFIYSDQFNETTHKTKKKMITNRLIHLIKGRSKPKSSYKRWDGSEWKLNFKGRWSNKKENYLSLMMKNKILETLLWILQCNSSYKQCRSWNQIWARKRVLPRIQVNL